MNQNLNSRFQRKPESLKDSEEDHITALLANLEEEDSPDALKSEEQLSLVDLES